MNWFVALSQFFKTFNFKWFKSSKDFRIYHLNDLFKVQCTHNVKDYHYFYVHLVLETSVLVSRCLILSICMYFLHVYVACLYTVYGLSLLIFDELFHLCCRV
jgi:hypothetical protein